MGTNLNTKSVKLNEAKEYIIANVMLQCDEFAAPRIYMQGQPGCGKSDIMRQICQEKGWGLIVKYVSNMIFEQLTGLPVKPESEDIAKWTKPALFDFDDIEYKPDEYVEGVTPTVLLLDDFHLCDRIMQKFMFQLLTYKKLNGYALPEKTAIVMAGNRITDKAGAMPIPAPVVNRMLFLDVKCDYKDWLDNFAFKNGIREDICSFINQNGNKVLVTEPLESTPWASPRSWAYLSKQLDYREKCGLDMSLNKLLVTAIGALGNEIANDFIMYRELFAKWDFEKMMNSTWNKVKDEIKTSCDNNASSSYACLHSGIGWIFLKLREEGMTNTQKFKKYVEFMYDVFAYILSIKSMRTEALICESLSYIVNIQNKISNTSISYISDDFIDNCAKQRPIDYIMYKHLANIMTTNGSSISISDNDLEEIKKAEESIANGNTGL